MILVLKQCSVRMIRISVSKYVHYFLIFIFFFFNDTATTEIYTLSLHDALPIFVDDDDRPRRLHELDRLAPREPVARSEEHTSELQSQSNLVCRLLLEKKKIDTEMLAT